MLYTHTHTHTLTLARGRQTNGPDGKAHLHITLGRVLDERKDAKPLVEAGVQLMLSQETKEGLQDERARRPGCTVQIPPSQPRDLSVKKEGETAPVQS